MKFILLLILSLYSFAIQAECQNVNLYEIPDSPMKQIPIYDQDGSGTCYAYTSAQMINYHLLKKKVTTKPMVHPAWAAVNYAADHSLVSTQGGFVDETIKSLQKLPNHCAYESVSATLQSFGAAAGLNEPNVLAFLEKYINNYHTVSIREKKYIPTGIDNTWVAPSPQLQIAKKRDEERRNAFEAFKLTEKEMKKTCDIPELDKLEFELVNNFYYDIVNVMRTNFFKDCKSDKSKQFKLPPLSSSNLWAKVDLTNNTLAKALDTQLASQSPAGISYCTSFFNDLSKTHLEQKVIGKRLYRKAKPGCGMHASVVVGSRKTQTKSCEYLVKNTWGNYYWYPKGTCYCEHKKTGKKVGTCTKATHPQKDYNVLGCWIDSKQLLPNMADVTVIK